MVKYCGYLVRDDWLFQRAADLGHPPPMTPGDTMDIISLAARDLMAQTGVFGTAKFRQVITAKGTAFWCIAFASNDPCERLPTSAPTEKRYGALKEVLQKDFPPRWYRAY